MLNDITLYSSASINIDAIYFSGKAICSLLILILVLSVFLDMKNLWSKISLTIPATVAIAIHYVTIARLSTYIQFKIVPFMIIEMNTKVGTGTISIDHGQILALIIIIMWRKELSRAIKPVITPVLARLKRVSKPGRETSNSSQN